MKRIILLLIVILPFTGLVFSQTKSSSEIKGDEAYFKRDYEKAIFHYQSQELTEQGLRSYAHALEEMDQTIEAERAYAKLMKLTANNNMEDHFHYTNLLKINGKFKEFYASMDLFSSLKPLDSRSISYVRNKDNFDVLSMDNPLNKIQLLNMNTEHSDFGASFWKDQVVYVSNQLNPEMFNRIDSRTNEPFLNLYVADIKNEQFLQSHLFNRGMKDPTNDGPASFAKKGTFMAYTRNHLKDRSEDKIVELQIYFSTYEYNEWSEPTPFEYNYSSYSVGQPFLTEAGDSMYFTSDMPGGFGGKDIYLSTWSKEGYWIKPLNLGHEINTESDEMFPFYDEQSNILYFASDGHFGLGGLDLFYYLENAVVNLGAPINSRQDDFALILRVDGLHGYFSSNRSKGKGSDDMYSVNLSKKRTEERLIEGAAYDSGNHTLSNVYIRLFNQNNELIQSLESKDGQYRFIVMNTGYYTLKGTKEAYNEGVKKVYFSEKDTMVMANLFLSQTQIEKEESTPIVVEADSKKMMQLKSIYFDFDKSNIRKDATISLDDIVEIMNENPNMEVNLRSYTDCRGSEVYNQYLSDLRAQESVSYIQQRISKPLRISGKGFGELNPLNKCECQDHIVSPCTTKEHQQNRRTEFSAVKMWK
jgi:outer membrane protein OmpA-like peptidoglycan-associated protein